MHNLFSEYKGVKCFLLTRECEYNATSFSYYFMMNDLVPQGIV